MTLAPRPTHQGSTGAHTGVGVEIYRHWATGIWWRPTEVIPGVGGKGSRRQVPGGTAQSQFGATQAKSARLLAPTLSLHACIPGNLSIMFGYNLYDKYIRVLSLIPRPVPCAARFQGYGTYVASF